MYKFDIDWLGPHGKGAPKSVSQIRQPTIPPSIANKNASCDPVCKAAPIPIQASVARRKTKVRSAGSARNERQANATVIVSIIKSRSPNFGVSGRNTFLEFIYVPRKHELVFIPISQSSLLSNELFKALPRRLPIQSIRCRSRTASSQRRSQSNFKQTCREKEVRTPAPTPQCF